MTEVLRQGFACSTCPPSDIVREREHMSRPYSNDADRGFRANCTRADAREKLEGESATPRCIPDPTQAPEYGRGRDSLHSLWGCGQSQGGSRGETVRDRTIA